MPDNGTEALGRGGAFVAKASDPTAIQYNPAGLAEQRGTRLLLDGKWTLSSYELRRFGTFPDNPRDPATPWGGAMHAKVHDTGGPSFAPFFAATTDFGTLDWLTVAVGVFGPSGVGNRTYPVGVAGAPAASRYDVVQPSSLIVLPTLAVGIKATDWLDVGLGVHCVYGRFALTSTSFVDLGDGPMGPCKNAEYQPCDSLSRLDATGSSWAGTAGVLVHPSRAVSLGASVRTPISIDARGTATVLQAPLGQPNPAPGHGTLHTELPWYARAGAGRPCVRRHRHHRAAPLQGHVQHPRGRRVQQAHDRRRAFAAAGGVLRQVGHRRRSVVHAAGFRHARQNRRHRGRRLLVGRLHLQRGVRRGVRARRTVEPGQGNVRPIDRAQHGVPVDSQGNPLPAVNEGTYSGHTERIGVGLVAVFDEVLGSQRAKRGRDGGPSGASPTPAANKSAPPPKPEKSDWDD